MALTPEDVVNKRFQPTKFREGYDQDEVDDFLDEVVVELRRLNQENEELRQRLIASDSKITELQRTPSQPAPAAFDQPAQASAPAPVAVAEAPAPAFAGATVVDPSIDPSNTNNLLQLARRLHEEHVREGVEKRDALIAEGQSHAARVVDEANTQAGQVVEDANSQASRALEEATTQASRALEEANAQAARLVEEAQAQSRDHLSALEQERTRLEDRIDELRNFEREYRSKLKGYIEGQLRELDTTSAVLNSAPSAPVPGAVPAGVAQVQSYTGEIAPPPATYPGFAGN
jgi:DivIVA domain-containing protein